jgi:pyruvate dehydrogenase E2 component (dihydrolipoamide acetyltransferase)
MLFRICVECDHTNPPDSRFCGKCGAPLQVRFCRLCRSANDAVSRYCRSCGTELPELTAPEASPPPNAPRPATIPPLVIATPGRPVAEAASASTPSTTIAAAFSGDEVRGKADAETGAPAFDGTNAQPVGGKGAQPAIEVRPARPAHATPIVVESAVTTVNLPIVTDDTRPPARTWRAPRAAAVLAIAAIVAAFGALAFKAWRTDGANQRSDRAEVPAAPQPAPMVVPAPPPGADQTNAAPPAPAAAPAAEPAAPPPAAGSTKTVPRERREVAPPGAGRPAAAPTAPALPPALSECTPAVAALGLCTPEPKPEGN